MLWRLALDLRGKDALQLVEVERLLKLSCGTQIHAVFLVFRLQLLSGRIWGNRCATLEKER